MSMLVTMFVTWLASKGQEPKPEHVEGSHGSTTGSDPEHDRDGIAAVGLHEGISLFQDGILGIIATKSDEKGNAGTSNRQATDQHREGCIGNLAPEPTH